MTATFDRSPARTSSRASPQRCRSSCSVCNFGFRQLRTSPPYPASVRPSAACIAGQNSLERIPARRTSRQRVRTPSAREIDAAGPARSSAAAQPASPASTIASNQAVPQTPHLVSTRTLIALFSHTAIPKCAPSIRAPQYPSRIIWRSTQVFPSSRLRIDHTSRLTSSAGARLASSQLRSYAASYLVAPQLEVPIHGALSPPCPHGGCPASAQSYWRTGPCQPSRTSARIRPAIPWLRPEMRMPA